MSDLGKSIYQPVNDPIQAQAQVSSCIEILDFDDTVFSGDISKIQVLFERIGQEIYNIRKKNYSWGFRVIEPEFLNFSKSIVMVSRLYKDEDLTDLNSVVFKLFTEFNNIVLSTALHMHIPVRGIIQIGDTYRGTVKSRKPAVVGGKEPLILADLLKVFSFGEIFPRGFTSGLIPAVDIPFHFGQGLCRSSKELAQLESVGIFMPSEQNKDHIADVTVLSNMMVKTEINGASWYACNWKEWMNEHNGCSTENIIAFAEAEVSKASGPHDAKWKSLIDYSAHL